MLEKLPYLIELQCIKCLSESSGVKRMSEKKRLNAMMIYKLLPQTNCRICGEPNCMAFTVKLLNRSVELKQCTPLFDEEQYAEKAEKLKELIAPLELAKETGIILEDEKCIGCGNCVVCCPANATVAPETSGGKGIKEAHPDIIFLVEKGLARICKLERCRRYEPPRTNCRVCEMMCPTKAIEILQ